jgi:hypothetical protein
MQRCEPSNVKQFELVLALNLPVNRLGVLVIFSIVSVIGLRNALIDGGLDLHLVRSFSIL